MSRTSFLSQSISSCVHLSLLNAVSYASGQSLTTEIHSHVIASCVGWTD